MAKKDLKIPELVTVSRKQLSSEIHKGNEYRHLLGKCLLAFNSMVNQSCKIENNNISNTYKIAKLIEIAFKEYD